VIDDNETALHEICSIGQCPTEKYDKR